MAVNAVADACVLRLASRLLIEAELAQQPAGAGLGSVADLDGGMLSKLAEPVPDHDPVLVEQRLSPVGAVQALYEEPQELYFVALEAPGGVQVAPNLASTGSQAGGSGGVRLLVKGSSSNFSSVSTSDDWRRAQHARLCQASEKRRSPLSSDSTTVRLKLRRIRVVEVVTDLSEQLDLSTTR